MATTVASLRILLGLDSKGVQDGAGSVKSELKGIQAEANKTKSTFSDLKGGIAAGFGLGAGLGAFQLADRAVSTFVDGLNTSVKAASALNETMSKSAVVFGTHAQAVAVWGDTAATSLGLSKQAAVEAAASFGNLFSGVGLAQGDAAAMSQSIVQLAGDLGSFNNIGTDEALQKIRSGLVGEAEPLRSVGVLLNEAAVAAKATELGFTKTNGAFTEGQKVQARYALILEQTKTAQGDFARTSDGLANSQKILNASVTDLAAAIGGALLPQIAQITSDAAKATKGLGDLGTAVGKFTGDIDKGAKQATGGTVDLGQAAEDLGGVLTTSVLGGINRTGDALNSLMGNLSGFQRSIYGSSAVLDALDASTGRATSSSNDLTAVSNDLTRAQLIASEAVDDHRAAQERLAAAGTALEQSSVDVTSGIIELTGTQAAAADAANAHRLALVGEEGASLSASLGMKSLADGTDAAKDASTQIIGPLSAEEAMLDRVAFAANVAARNLAAMGTAATVADQASTDALRRFGEVPGAVPGGLVGGGGPTVQPGVQNQDLLDAVKRAGELADFNKRQHDKAVADAKAAAAKAEAERKRAAAEAKRAEDELNRQRVEIANKTFDRMADAAHRYFDDLHKANLKSIDDAQKTADAEIEARKKANLEPATAAEARLRAVQQQRQLAKLQADLAAAKTPEERLAATQALSDFNAQARIDFLRKQGEAANTILDEQKKKTDQGYADQKDAENRRNADQVNLFDENLKSLREYVGKHPAEWKKATDKVTAVLKAAGIDYEKVGAENANAYIRGVNKAFAGFGAPPAAAPGGKAPAAGTSAAVAATAGLTFVGGGVKGDVYLDGAKVGEFIERYLAANASATTSGYTARHN